MMASIYRVHMPTPDPHEWERANRMYEYMKEKIKVEIRLNPYPTDEGYQKLLIEVAKSCCSQEQRIELVGLLRVEEKEGEDE